MELLDGGSATLVGSDDLHLHDLDGVGASTMASSHIPIALSDGSRGGQVSVLSVHVVGAATRVVTQPDTKVLHLQRGFLVNQATVDCLSGGLLHLPQLGDEVPETGLGHDMVRGEDPHPVQRGGRVLGRGQQTPNDFVFPKLCRDGRRYIYMRTDSNISCFSF